MRQLVAACVRHADGDQRVFFGVVVELGAGIRVRDRNLNGFVVQALGEIDGLAERLARFARQADDEIAVDHQAQLLAVRGEALRHIDGGALLDVLQNLLVADS